MCECTCVCRCVCACRWYLTGDHRNVCFQPQCDGKPLEGYVHFHFSTFSVKQEAKLIISNKGCYICGETEV